MRRVVGSALLILVLFASPGYPLAAVGTSVEVAPAVTQPDITATVNVPVLNVRQGPGTGFAVVAQVKSGTQLVVLGRNAAGDWLQVRIPAPVTGWVSAQLVTPSVSTAAIPVVSAPPPSVSAASVNPPSYAGLPFKPNTTTSREGYIHECFGAGDSPLRQVAAGTPVQVLGVGSFSPPPEEVDKLGDGPFLKIRLWDGQFAWIAARNVQVDIAGLPQLSGQCAEYDRIDWSRVIRPTATPRPYQPASPSGSYGSGCCKICTTGKACGDTCIARNKTCHVGSGCACNG